LYDTAGRSFENLIFERRAFRIVLLKACLRGVGAYSYLPSISDARLAGGIKLVAKLLNAATPGLCVRAFCWCSAFYL
jgi:hypothetical protein